MMLHVTSTFKYAFLAWFFAYRFVGAELFVLFHRTMKWFVAPCILREIKQFV